MKHAYLTKSDVEDALVHHIITKQEARTLEKRLTICKERLRKH